MEGERLTKPDTYDFDSSNIALLGSDLEKHVREHAAETEPAWQTPDLKTPGILIWRVEKFTLKPWPKERYGTFYNSDSYIVVHIYKQHPDSEALSYDVHFWLGEATTPDEAGTAAYKTAELDDVLDGVPVEYRETMGHESSRFLSYFRKFLVQKGGIASGFHHVSSPPPQSTLRLYRIHAETAPSPAKGSSSTQSPARTPVIVREIDPTAATAIEAGDVYVLDKGREILQLNTTGSVGREKFKAQEFAGELAAHPDRHGTCTVSVFDQGSAGAGRFFTALGVQASASPEVKPTSLGSGPSLLRVSDEGGTVTFSPVNPSGGSPTMNDLSTNDAFLVDCTHIANHPTIFIWIGSASDAVERRMALEFAQRYLVERHLPHRTSIVKMMEGHESSLFRTSLGA